MNLRISRRADRDLDAIWAYIAIDSESAADRVEVELHAAMKLLAEFPYIGHRREDVANPDYRFWNLYDFVIAYRVRRQSVVVVRVLHGRRDFRQIFQ